MVVDPNALDDQDQPDESQVSEAISPSKGSTSAPPVGQGPYETKKTPAWSSQTGSTNTIPTKGIGSLQDLSGTPAGLAGVIQTIKAIEGNKDYFQEARNLLPAPPTYPGMTTKGWAALAPGIALSVFGGGAPGAVSAGRAIGAAQIGSNQAAQQNWENQYRYSTGIGSLANQMETQGREVANAALPYIFARQGQQEQINEEDMRRVQQYQEFQATFAQKSKDQDIRLEALTGTNQYHQDYIQMERDRTQEMQANTDALNAYRAGQLDVAQRRATDAERFHQDEMDLRDKQFNLALSKFGQTGGRDPQQIQAMRDYAATLQSQMQDLQSSATMLDPTKDAAAWQTNQDDQKDLQDKMKAVSQALAGIANIPALPTTRGSTSTTTDGNTGGPPNPGAPTGQGGGPQNPKIPPNATLAGTDKRTGHPVYRAPDGRLYDGVTGQLLN